eukprot:SAG11_NODE_4984_length_1703_cov_2.989401_2_plen_66_part_00
MEALSPAMLVQRPGLATLDNVPGGKGHGTTIAPPDQKTQSSATLARLQGRAVEIDLANEKDEDTG